MAIKTKTPKGQGDWQPNLLIPRCALCVLAMLVIDSFVAIKVLTKNSRFVDDLLLCFVSKLFTTDGMDTDKPHQTSGNALYLLDRILPRSSEIPLFATPSWVGCWPRPDLLPVDRRMEPPGRGSASGTLCI